MIRLIALTTLLIAAPLGANESIVSGLSDNRVAITANFVGSEILVYGAVKRDAPPPGDAPMHVIITAEGPAVTHTLRQKEKVAGIWINTTAVELASAPSFYAVVTTGPLGKTLSSTDDLRYKISLDHVVQDVGMTAVTDQPKLFLQALERLRPVSGRNPFPRRYQAAGKPYRRQLPGADFPDPQRRGDRPSRTGGRGAQSRAGTHIVSIGL
jgi:uncharacterized protein (TIGR02186 family)